MTIKADGAAEGGQPKKQYESPRLEVYGDIRVITEAVSHSGMTDGGSMGRRTA